MKIEKLNEKLTKYEQAQEKIQANNKIDELLIKADIRLGELEREKDDINKKIAGYQFEINNLNEKIDKNKKLIEKIKEESSKERVYKVYLETFGKNGISKLIMKTMMPITRYIII
jgi:septal ring factor EnvC (AmiA/AmiB activator)